MGNVLWIPRLYTFSYPLVIYSLPNSLCILDWFEPPCIILSNWFHQPWYSFILGRTKTVPSLRWTLPFLRNYETFWMWKRTNWLGAEAPVHQTLEGEFIKSWRACSSNLVIFISNQVCFALMWVFPWIWKWNSMYFAVWCRVSLIVSILNVRIEEEWM